MENSSVDKIIVFIAGLQKTEIKTKLMNFKGKPRLDFTEDYLESLSEDKLRHILLAAVVTKHKKMKCFC